MKEKRNRTERTVTKMLSIWRLWFDSLTDRTQRSSLRRLAVRSCLYTHTRTHTYTSRCFQVFDK